MNNCVPGTVNAGAGADGIEITAGTASVAEGILGIVSRTGCVVVGDVTAAIGSIKSLLFMSVLLLFDGVVLGVRCPDPERLLSVNFLNGSHTELVEGFSIVDSLLSIMGIVTLLLTSVGSVIDADVSVGVDADTDTDPSAYVGIISFLDVGDTGDTGDIGICTSTGTLGMDNS